MRWKPIFFFLLFAGFGAQWSLVRAQNNVHPEHSEGKALNEDVQKSQAILESLDSMMKLWYVRTSTPSKARHAENIYNFKANEVPVYSDSAYGYRIHKIISPLPY